MRSLAKDRFAPGGRIGAALLGAVLTGGLLLATIVPSATAAGVHLTNTRVVPPAGAVVTPPPRIGASVAYDVKDGYLLLFGGYDGPTTYADTWVFEHGAWHALNLSVHPSARFGASMAYDPADGSVLLFGGFSNARNVALDSTWEFSGGAWSRLLPSGHPGARYDSGMVFDPKGGFVLLYGGEGTRYHSAFFDTWEFAQGNWTRAKSPGNPSVYTGEGLTYDAKDGYVLLFGGQRSPGVGSNQTWQFAHLHWSQIPTASAPSARSAAALAFDRSDGVVVLFGGFSGTTYLRSTWTFVGGVWSKVVLAKAPPALESPEMVFDRADSQAVLIGYDASAANAVETWGFSAGAWSRLA